MSESWTLWAVELDGKKVRLDDFPFGFWEKVSRQLLELGADGYGIILSKPMTFPDIAYDCAVEAARLLGNADPEAKVDEILAGPYGEPSLKNLGNLFVLVDDDLPTEMHTGDDQQTAVPPVGDETSTA